MFETSEKSGPSREALENAARWFTRLESDAANAQTFADWQQWLCAAPEHRVAYDEIEDTVLRLKRGATSPALPSEEEMSTDGYDGSVSVAEWRRRTIARNEGPKTGRALAAGVAVGLFDRCLAVDALFARAAIGVLRVSDRAGAKTGGRAGGGLESHARCGFRPYRAADSRASRLGSFAWRSLLPGGARPRPSVCSDCGCNASDCPGHRLQCADE